MNYTIMLVNSKETTSYQNILANINTKEILKWKQSIQKRIIKK